MEAFKGWLASDGNRSDRVKPKAGLTARQTSRAGAKAGLSELFVVSSNANNHRIKATPGMDTVI